MVIVIITHNNASFLNLQLPQQCKQPPFEMSNYTKAVAIHDHVYIGGGFTSSAKKLATILEYNYQTGDWKEIEEHCPRKYFGMAVIKSKLYVVAGIDVTKGSRQGSIYTLDLESMDTIWKELPCAPMNDGRSTPSVVSYDEKWLIVIGGKSMNGAALDSVESVNIENLVDNQCYWCRSSKLPIKCAHFSSAIVGDHIFTFATKVFKGNSERFSNTVYYAPLTSLVQSGDKSNAESAIVWKEIRHLPLKASTALSYDGSLLALGGIEKDSIASSCIFKLEYNPNSDDQPVWKKIDNLPCALYQCAAVQILNQIFVHGCCETSDVCVYVHTLEL